MGWSCTGNLLKLKPVEFPNLFPLRTCYRLKINNKKTPIKLVISLRSAHPHINGKKCRNILFLPSILIFWYLALKQQMSSFIFRYSINSTNQQCSFLCTDRSRVWHTWLSHLACHQVTAVSSFPCSLPLVICGNPLFYPSSYLNYSTFRLYRS